MYRWELVEGDNTEEELVGPEFETVQGKSIMALMWSMIKPLWVTGKMVSMNISFCVLKGLIGMYNRGVNGSTVVKKRGYQPSGIYGDQINVHFEKNR